MRSKLRAMLFGLGGVVALTSCASRPRINVVIMDDDDRYAEQIGDVRVVIGCKPGLAEEVALLFAHLRDLSRRGINLTDGSKVPYGWTTFSLQAVRGRLEVWEPNYEQETERLGRPEISASLIVDAAQRSFLSKLSVDSFEVQYDQHILVSSEAWEASEVMLFRVESPGGRMSGWRMVDPRSETDTMESVPIYEVYRRRPEFMVSLTLPPGYLVYYHAGAPSMVMDSADHIIWEDGTAAPLAPTGGGTPGVAKLPLL